MLHYATVQGMQSKFLWKNFFQPISSWNGPGHRGDVRRGGERAAGTGGSGSGAQMPTLQANAHTRRNSLYDLPRT